MSLSRLENFQLRLEQLNRHRIRKIKDRSNPLEEFSESAFKSRFRLSKQTAVYVLDLIINDMEQSAWSGFQLPPILKFLVVLRFYATGSFQIVIGDLQNLPQGTISKWVKKISTALAKQSRNFIKYPSFEEAIRIRQKFFEVANFPGVTGAIDCTHIQIISPGGLNAELFRNRKGVFSLNVQAVCDPDLIFTNLVARWYGSAHDSRIFNDSNLSTSLENGEVPPLLVGDSGYGCTQYLMTPYDNPITKGQIRYNNAQVKTRNCIERAFGVLKRRFACLNFLRLKLKTSLSVIVSTAILHNIARGFGGLYGEEEEPIESNPENQTPRPTILGETVRNNIVLSHFSR